MVRIRIRRRPARAGLLATTFGLAVLSAIAGTAAASGSIRNGLIAYSRIAGDDVSIIVSRPDGSERRVLDLAQSGFLPSWSPDGRTLLLTTFLPDTLRPVLVNPTTGDTRILEVPDADREIALLCRAWTPNGKTLVCQGDSYSAAHPEVNGIYTIRAADGSHFKRLTFDAFPPIFGDEGTCGGGDQPGSVSPGGDRFVFTRTKCGTLPAPDRDQTAALFVMPLDGGHARQITPYGVPWSHEEGLAKWSPDGRRILFGTADGTLVTIRPDGSDQRTIPLETPGADPFAIAPEWSPDGTRIVMNLFMSNAPSGLYVADADGSHVGLLAVHGDSFLDEPDWARATD